MLKNPAVQENLRRLRERGVVVVEPERGILACEEEGEGRLADIERLKDWILWALHPKPFKGKRILLTCGATREYIDPVRFVSNESSGEMGFSLARVARWMGARVKVVAGFTTAPEPPEADIVRVKTAEDMRRAVLEEFENSDVVIMNAAVADYTPARTSDRKMKKRKKLILELEQTPDILSELGKRRKTQILVGFALESEELLKNARRKLRQKKLDMIVANPPEVMGAEYHESAEFIMNRIAGFVSG